MLGLFFIYAEQFLGKDILCKCRTQIHHALLGEVRLDALVRIHHKMHMGMMRFVMKGRVPFQMLQRYFEVFSESRCLCAKHIPPPFTDIVSEPFRVLTTKRNNDRPYIAAVVIKLIRHLIQFYLYTVIGEQSVCSESLSSRSGGDIVRIGFRLPYFISVIFQSAGYEFRSVSHSRLLHIVLILQHFFAVGKVSKDFFNELLLLQRGRCKLKGFIYLIHAFSCCNIFCIASGTCSGIRFQIFELGDQLRHASLSFLPVECILEREAAVETLDFFYTFSAKPFK